MEDNNRTLTNNQELAEQFNTFFSKIIQNLKIDNKLVKITLNLYVFDPVLKAIKKYENTIKINREDEAQEHALFF